ncbi:MAG: 16S rRNA (guanine(966)-N(2))-methyltransferase RsmD [Gammaproteobacteria bacterium]|nr:16S rRNA (guanine(966)-N(2))-methyltransferase RsmD [Gammaproteobacteria bacterium]|tara:strand:- start:41 stop:610 length:570 start_codon:yes stop_codon:yes gene_type:complete
MANEISTIRIIAGTHRSRKISFPNKEEVRPTGSRIRETLFNWVQYRISSAVCLDLFAGSGALGIEALSRGAREAVFIEKNPITAAALSQNIELLNLTKCEIHQIDALQWASTRQFTRKFNLVFLDPPFESSLLKKSCVALEKSELLAENCLIYVEKPNPANPEDVPLEWSMEKETKIGNVFFFLYSRNV